MQNTLEITVLHLYCITLHYLALFCLFSHFLLSLFISFGEICTSDWLFQNFWSKSSMQQSPRHRSKTRAPRRSMRSAIQWTAFRLHSCQTTQWPQTSGLQFFHQPQPRRVGSDVLSFALNETTSWSFGLSSFLFFWKIQTLFSTHTLDFALKAMFEESHVWTVLERVEVCV